MEILDNFKDDKVVCFEFNPDECYTKWKLDNQGYIVNLETRRCLTVYADENNPNIFYFYCESRHRADTWEFRSD